MLGQEINAILGNTQPSLIELYFEIQQHCEAKYGEDTVVLMEIGSFFEVYGIDNGKETLGNPKEIAEILNLQLTRRNKSIPENSVQNPLMAGFPGAAFDRYVSRLVQEQRYTIVVIRQRGESPKVTRYLDRIISPGINFEYTIDHDDNFIASLIVDQDRAGIYSLGYAATDITTGKSYLTEMYGTREDPTYALDEVFTLLRSHRTSEIVCTIINGTIASETIESYLEIHDDITIKYNTKRVEIAYQNELFRQAYAIQSSLTPIEFLDLERTPLASEALGSLLEFIIDHDYYIVQQLNTPIWLDAKRYVYLGNNPLEQLNIISKDPDEYTVLRFLDKTSTSLGRRLLRERLIHPLKDRAELEQRYDLVESVRSIYIDIDKELKNIYDLERIARRIALQRLHPFEINFLYDSLQAVDRLQHFKELQSIYTLGDTMQECIQYLQHVFDLDSTTQASLTDISTPFFRLGFNPQLDTLITQQHALIDRLEAIRTSIVNILNQTTGKDENEYVVIRQLDKEGHYISLTKNRYHAIQSILQKHIITVEDTTYSFKDFKVKVQTANVKITGTVIDELSEEIILLQTKMNAVVKELYLEVLKEFNQKYGSSLQEIISLIAKIDVAVSTVKTTIAYNLHRPEIIMPKESNSILELTQVRHPLVEAREENGIYVPNDVVLGENQPRGMLLFGINSSGKSSLMKSIGICIVLAQSGFFVPAQAMRFSIFNEIFTRILARDNFMKGLSSFAVEMLELKNIFNRCSSKSIVLGDEISHGTETLSAISIVTAAILRLVEQQAIFLFATHLHQLNQIDRIKVLSEITSKHLAVHYDKDNDKLIFDRTLQEGSGSSMYGLEFAQSLHLDKQFMKIATDVRKKLTDQFEDLELLTQQRRSKYNKDVFLTSCAICEGPVDDTHHITPQQVADEHGNIAHFHKDHKYNLIPLCKNCHKKVHTGKLIIRGFVMTSQGLELQYTENA